MATPNKREGSAAITPSDLKAEAKRLIATGKMPSLEEVMTAIKSVRAEYLLKIKVARKAADSSRGNPQRKNQCSEES